MYRILVLELRDRVEGHLRKKQFILQGVLCADPISFQELSVNLFILLLYVLTGIKSTIEPIQLQKRFIPGGQRGHFFLTYNESTMMTVEKDEHNLLWVATMQFLFQRHYKVFFMFDLIQETVFSIRLTLFQKHMRNTNGYSI